MKTLRLILWRAASVFERVRTGLLYAAVGTMRLEELRRAIAGYWDDFNVGEQNVDAGFMSWEQKLADRFVAAGDDVLLVGSGTGRDVLTFARMGCRVTGVEPSLPATARARSLIEAQRLDATILDGFFESIALSGRFDVVVFSYFCFSMIPESRRRLEVLTKARECLKPGGRLVISFLFREKPPDGRAARIGRLAGALARTDWRLEPGDLVERGGLGPGALNFEHIFGPGEIEREGARAGLVVAGRGGHPHEEPFVVFTASS